jgi:hypothetical protein
MGVYSYALKGLKAGATKLAQKLSGQGKTKFTGKAIDKVKPGTQLTKKRKSQDDFTDFRSKLHTSAGFDTATKNKLKMKHPLYKSNKKTSDIFTPKEPKLATGGRVGRKFGGGMDMGRRKTAVEKIKETFGPKKTAAKNKNLKPVDKKKNPGLAKLPIEVRNKMGYAKKGGRA